MLPNRFRNTIHDALDPERASSDTLRRVGGPLRKHGYRLEGHDADELTFVRRDRSIIRGTRERQVRIRFVELTDGSLVTVEGDIAPQGQRELMSALIAR